MCSCVWLAPLHEIPGVKTQNDRCVSTQMYYVLYLCGVEVSVSEYMREIPASVSPDLVLGRELLHVCAETSEARQEVVDHHLLRNDCRGG